MWFIQAVATGEALTIGVKAGVNLNRLHAALVDGEGRLFVAGESGTLLTSANLGTSWTLVPLGTTSALYGLQDL